MKRTRDSVARLPDQDSPEWETLVLRWDCNRYRAHFTSALSADLVQELPQALIPVSCRPGGKPLGTSDQIISSPQPQPRNDTEAHPTPSGHVKEGMTVRAMYGSQRHAYIRTRDETEPRQGDEPAARCSRHRLPASVIKSGLQKDVRRGRTEAAVKTAYALAGSEFLEFVRRMCIVMIEDATLHPDLPVFVWVLVHIHLNPLFWPTQSLMHQLVSVAADLADCPVKDCEAADHRQENAMRLDAASTSTLEKCLLVRASFGGMAGDMVMLRNAARVWAARRLRLHKPLMLCPVRDRDRTIGPETLTLTCADMFEDAVDFHCCPDMLEWIATRNKALSALQIKRCIWLFRSAVTTKTNAVPTAAIRDDEMERLTPINAIVAPLIDAYMEHVRIRWGVRAAK